MHTPRCIRCGGEWRSGRGGGLMKLFDIESLESLATAGCHWPATLSTRRGSVRVVVRARPNGPGYVLNIKSPSRLASSCLERPRSDTTLCLPATAIVVCTTSYLQAGATSALVAHTTHYDTPGGSRQDTPALHGRLHQPAICLSTPCPRPARPHRPHASTLFSEYDRVSTPFLPSRIARNKPHAY